MLVRPANWSIPGLDGTMDDGDSEAGCGSEARAVELRARGSSPGTTPSSSWTVGESRFGVGGGDLGLETPFDPMALTEQGHLTPPTRHRAKLSAPRQRARDRRGLGTARKLVAIQNIDGVLGHRYVIQNIVSPVAQLTKKNAKFGAVWEMKACRTWLPGGNNGAERSARSFGVAT